MKTQWTKKQKTAVTLVGVLVACVLVWSGVYAATAFLDLSMNVTIVEPQDPPQAATLDFYSDEALTEPTGQVWTIHYGDKEPGETAMVLSLWAHNPGAEDVTVYAVEKGTPPGTITVAPDSATISAGGTQVFTVSFTAASDAAPGTYDSFGVLFQDSPGVQ
jgi:hypothetical protein